MISFKPEKQAGSLGHEPDAEPKPKVKRRLRRRKVADPSPTTRELVAAIRRVFGLGALLLGGCTTMHHPSFFDTSLEKADKCFTTAHGLDVYVQGIPCPSEVEVNKIEANLLRDLRSPTQDLSGGGLTFRRAPGTVLSAPGAKRKVVEDFIACGGTVAPGCTEGRVSLVQKTEDWKYLFRHEVGHQIRTIRGKPADGGHDDCDYWARVNEAFPWCGSDPELEWAAQ